MTHPSQMPYRAQLTGHCTARKPKRFLDLPALKAVRAAAREMALDRMQILVDSAVRTARTDPRLAERYACLARRISTRYRIRMPYQLQIIFCKRCKSFIAPGVNSRLRLGRSSIRAIRITCGLCGHTYRKIMP